MNSEYYNFIIVGAGPAGLTAGIVAARSGLSAIILEKGEKAGPKKEWHMHKLLMIY